MTNASGDMIAGVPLLATKCYVPQRRPGLVTRPRLVARLDEGTARKLTLVAAPAGFGKTTLLAEWLGSPAAGARRVAWVSLDPGDNDPALFWAYVITALQTVRPGVGEHALALLQSPQPPAIESVLATLINEIAAVEGDVALVLDDFHVVQGRPIPEAVTFLLDHLPPHLHLVIASRADPPLPLARLRGRGELAEIRVADLRFTPNEAAAFLNAVAGLDLAAGDVAVLEARTEGWIAGLQLASLSLRGRADAAGFIRAFAGDDRYVLDYLADEVLRRQTDDVRCFLLQTSILDRLSGPLCDAVTGRNDGAGMLEALERGNLFVVPLDDKRHWYRYHHLFADVLLAHLMAEQPDRISGLHRRASEWYEQQGLPARAIRHALAGADVERAANLIEPAVPAMRQSRQEATLLDWLTALPDEVVRARPVLSVTYAGALLASGEMDGVEVRLRDAERWLDRTGDGHALPGTEMVVVDNEAFRGLPATIAIYHAALSLTRGDVPATVHHAGRARDLVSEDDHLLRGAAAGFLGLASWAGGDLEAAHQAYAECMVRVLRAGYVADALGCTIALADIRIAQGRLREAKRTFEQALRLAAEQGDPAQRGTADMYVGMSALCREQNDLDTAAQLLRRSQALGELAELRQNPYRWRVAMAGIREAQGDLDGALDLLDAADRLYVSDFFPNVHPIAALKARVWLAQGRLGEALAWARERCLSAEDELGYLREFEHITLARVLLAHRQRDRVDEHSLGEALGLLERLLHAADAGERTGSVIQILALQALAHHAQDNTAGALVPLERALTLAEPEGYVRMFVDEGPPMASLLAVAAKRGIAPTYARQLLTAFGTAEERPPATQDVIEPLSDRELDVLRLLATDLDGPDIARELAVSLNTMRTHTKNIYGKLGVNNRRAAVRRAEELALVPRARKH